MEKGFVETLIRSIKAMYPLADVTRSADRMTLGIPDIMAMIPVGPVVEDRLNLVWALAIEAKQLRTLMETPFSKGRRTGQMLKHPFSGPQISKLRSLRRAGVDAFGIVRVSSDTAFKILPDDISAKTGNFTHDELMKFGIPVVRERGIWPFWIRSTDSDVSVFGAGH